MIHEKRMTLAEYVTELQSKGRIVFAAEEAVEALGTNRGAFLDAAQRLQKTWSADQSAQGILCRRPAAIRLLGGAAPILVRGRAHAAGSSNPITSASSRPGNCTVQPIRPSWSSRS